jgi:hypothetical protein
MRPSFCNRLARGGQVWRLPPWYSPRLCSPGSLPTLAASPVIPEKAASGIGGPFTLVDQDGRTITDEKFRGKWLLVYFGYTHCPDACPTALSDMAEAISDLDPLSATRFSQSSSASTPSATRRQS